MTGWNIRSGVMYVLCACLCAITLLGCNQKKTEPRVLRVEKGGIYRHREDIALTPGEVEIKRGEAPSPSYPWRRQWMGTIPQITKEFFRCRGGKESEQKLHKNPYGKGVYLFDCGGSDRHSLPLKGGERGGEEFIYPILVDLLNYVQEKVGRRVIITSGHRCPLHNAYIDPSKGNRTSKHLVGAEVDFYVEGWEEKPEGILQIILQFYRDKSDPFGAFKRRYNSVYGVYEWYNQEVKMRIYRKDEGRNGDNQHPYPYLCIEVLKDRSTGRSVRYTWHQSFNGYKRW